MEHHLRLTSEEILALRRTVNLVARAGHQYGHDDLRFLALLEVLEEKLDTDLALCRHCHGQPRRTTDGLCRACDQYRRDQATLPSPAVLRKRILRKQLRLTA